MFHLLSLRNERGSVIITTNLESSRWGELFPDAMLAGALVDRLTHRSHILNMNGESYRLASRLNAVEVDPFRKREVLPTPPPPD
ncbi:MAG: ATP-binding protein [Bacteroidota bacterium]